MANLRCKKPKIIYFDSHENTLLLRCEKKEKYECLTLAASTYKIFKAKQQV